MIDVTQWVAPLAGGFLIGVASLCLLLLNGRIAGISGILGSVGEVLKNQEYWRIAFVLGLFIGGLGWFYFFPLAAQIKTNVSLPILIVGGLLVGIGTRLGSGCTSGHGVCGLSRFSVRSFVAVCVFLVVAVITATTMHVLGFGG